MGHRPTKDPGRETTCMGQLNIRWTNVRRLRVVERRRDTDYPVGLAAAKRLCERSNTVHTAALGRKRRDVSVDVPQHTLNLNRLVAGEPNRGHVVDLVVTCCDVRVQNGKNTETGSALRQLMTAQPRLVGLDIRLEVGPQRLGVLGVPCNVNVQTCFDVQWVVRAHLHTGSRSAYTLEGPHCDSMDLCTAHVPL